MFSHSPVAVTSLYAALLAPLFIYLSYRVIARRRSEKIAIGLGGNSALERAARVQANFAEYVPLALVLMLLAEIAGTPRWLLHIAGLALLAGRLSHAWGVSRSPEDFRFRIGGMMTTFGVLGVLSALLLVSLVW